MKLVGENAAYNILDGLFSRIEENGYTATKEMLNETMDKFCDLPGVNIDIIIAGVEELKDLCDDTLNAVISS